MTRRANTNVNWQQRATEFSVGDRVVPYGHGDDLGGRVLALYPAIGMADVEFPHGNKRYPVEDLQRLDEYGVSVPPSESTVPSGVGTVSVPGGPVPQADATRVARAFVKKSLYWGSKDRQYRATQDEVDGGQYRCPQCKGRGEESYLKPAIYKRRGGQSEKLLGCPICLFLVKRSDIIGDPSYEEYVEKKVPFADRRVEVP